MRELGKGDKMRALMKRATVNPHNGQFEVEKPLTNMLLLVSYQVMNLKRLTDPIKEYCRVVLVASRFTAGENVYELCPEELLTKNEIEGRDYLSISYCELDKAMK
jgi:hypothetical protein